MNYFTEVRKLFCTSPRLYRQDHSRGRGLTTTGQPTVSLLPLKNPDSVELVPIYIKFRRKKSSPKLAGALPIASCRVRELLCGECDSRCGGLTGHRWNF